MKRIFTVLLAMALLLCILTCLPLSVSAVSEAYADDSYEEDIAALVGESLEEPDFAIDLQSSIKKDRKGEQIMTVVLTLRDIKDDFEMHSLNAKLYYDAERLTMTNGFRADLSVDCVTALPYGEESTWENLTTARVDGLIDICFVVSDKPEQVLDAEHPIVLTFTFALTEGYEKAGVYIPTESVYGVNCDDWETLEGNGAYTVAEREDFIYEIADDQATVTGYNGRGGDVVIPSTLGGYPVTAIGDNAFYCCDNVTSIEIPNGVTAIGESAFSGCNSLVSINIPNGVTTIEYRTFFDCTGLKSINIPNGVTTIRPWAFNSTGLTNVEIPDSVTEIGDYAFANSSLTSVTIPNGVTTIESGVFYNCYDLTSIEIQGDVTKIGDGAFDCCSSLTSIEIPDGVTEIGSWAFYGCASLASINIPDGVTEIGSAAFFNCTSLASINIPDGVTYIGFRTFEGCTSLSDVIFGSGVKEIEMHAFAFCSSLTSIAIPDGVTTIGENAFWSCSGLKSASIPDSVTTIEWGLFDDCDNLTDVYCLAPSKPDGWDDEWLGDCSATVHWGMEMPCEHKNITTSHKDATCTEAGYEDVICNDCGETISHTELPATGTHSYGAWKETKAPTCTEEGTEERECSVCGHKETRAKAMISHNYVDGICTACGAKDPAYVEPEAPDDPGSPDDPEPPAPILGDVDGDGKIDATDYMKLKRFCLGSFDLTDEQKAVVDVNKDGKVNSLDYMMIKRHVLGTYKIA